MNRNAEITVMPVEFRYRRLGYVALNVSDSTRSHDFYQSIVGLAAAGEAADGERLYRCSARHHDIVLHQATTPGLRRIGWEMASDGDLDRIHHHLTRTLRLRAQDVAAELCAGLGLNRAFRVSEPHTGASFEYYSAMAPGNVPFVPALTRIVRLGHVVLGTPDHADSERFCLEQLNFRASDRIDGAVTFMRCFPNPRHHSFGLSKAAAPGLHHVNFMVTDIDDIGKAMYRLRRHEVPIVFGPGRHPPSESIFLYFLDPDGITLEYSFGMEEFPEVDPRPPRLLPFALDSIDCWGAAPEARFGQSGVIETMPG